MSFTRFNYDTERTKKVLQESTFAGRYFLNTPGPGSDLPFMEDCQLRLQKWGANAYSEGANIESDLRGLTRTYTRDHVDLNNYTDHHYVSQPLSYTKQKPFIEESRASHPAWECLDKEVFHFEYPHYNPQEYLLKTIPQNSQTRIEAKDNYTTTTASTTNTQHENMELLLPNMERSQRVQQRGYDCKECKFERR